MSGNTIVMLVSLAVAIGSVGWAIVPKLYRMIRDHRQFNRITREFEALLDSGEPVTEADWANYRAQVAKYLL